jgi:lysozyme
MTRIWACSGSSPLKDWLFFVLLLVLASDQAKLGRMLALGFWLGVAILMAIIMTAVPGRAAGHLHQIVIPSVYTLGHLAHGDGTKRMGRRINDAGIELIKRFEGCRLTTYRCAANQLTIGYGHCGKDVKPGMTITLEEAERLLAEDLRRFEEGVERLVQVPITENMQAALVSFTYNMGIAELKNSTLLRMLNNKLYQEAAAQFGRFVYASGVLLPGLVKRRAAERELFLTPVRRI